MLMPARICREKMSEQRYNIFMNMRLNSAQVADSVFNLN